MISSTLVLDLGNEVVIPLVPFVSPIANYGHVRRNW